MHIFFELTSANFSKKKKSILLLVLCVRGAVLVILSTCIAS